MKTLSSEQLREIRRIYGATVTSTECNEIYERIRLQALQGILDAQSERLAVELDMVVWKKEWKRGEKMWCEV